MGDWYDVEDAGEVIPEDLHGHPTSHEELWVFDLEGFPRGTGEIFPTAVVSWGELFEEVGEAQWETAILVWVETGCHVVDADDLPCACDFVDRFCGSWDSEQDYAAHLADAPDGGVFSFRFH